MSLSLDRVAYAASEYRKTIPLVDASVKIRDPLAQQLEYDTLIVSEIEATAFGQEILDLRKKNYNDWTLSVRRTDVYDAIMIGDTVTLFYPRFGLDNGRDFIVKKISVQAAKKSIDFSLYGPK